MYEVPIPDFHIFFIFPTLITFSLKCLLTERSASVCKLGRQLYVVEYIWKILSHASKL